MSELTDMEALAFRKDKKIAELNQRIADLEAAYDKCKADSDEVATRCSELEAENAELKTCLQLTARDCEHLHHNKSEYHSHREPCPVEIRIRKAVGDE